MLRPLLLLHLLLSLLPAHAQTENNPWTGTWQTYWRGGAALLHLTQTNTTVTGSYPLYEGTVEAKVSDRNLVGHWTEASGRHGTFLFILSPDGETFMGRFESGEWWTGTRISTNTQHSTSPANLTSPRETLRSFLQAANAARAGSIERIQPALDAIDFSSLESERLDGSTPLPQERINYALKLFQALDLCTFRVWGMPDPSEPGFPETNSISVPLPQAGSTQTFLLTFTHENHKWLISPPPSPQLTASLQSLELARTGIHRSPKQHLQLQNPRDTMRTFIEAMAQYDLGGKTNALKTLDLASFPVDVEEEEAELMAYYLKHVIDRIGFVLYQEIPDNPQQPEPYVHFRHPTGNVTIAPFTSNTTNTTWLFTAETLHNIRTLYSAIENMPEESGYSGGTESSFFLVREKLRTYTPYLLKQLGPMEAWQWIALTSFLLASYLQALLTVAILLWLLRQNPAWSQTFASKLAQNAVAWPLRFSMLGLFWFTNVGYLGLPEIVAGSSRRLAGTLAIASLAWLAYRGTNVASQFSSIKLGTSGHKAVLSSLTFGILRILILITTSLLLAQVWSVPYLSVLAGLGIGGLAFALAAQPTLQNMIAGFTLYADSPLSVGDFCRYGDKVGTVEQIGLRSTRIRSLERSIVSIPNSEFANLQLENLAKRDRMLLRITLQLRYETTPDQLRLVLTQLRKLLVAHPRVHPEPARVRFTEFGAHSLDVDLFAYVTTRDHSEYLSIREDLLLRIMQIIADAGTSFAFPSTVNYWTRDPGNNPTLTQQAEETVQAWRNSSSLPFPNLSPDEIRHLDGTLDFPPKGSPPPPKNQ